MGPERALPRRLHADERGAALVETAVVLPVLLVLVFGIVMVGRVVQAQVAVQSVVREAGRTAALAPSADAGLTDGAARALAVAAGHGLSTEALEVGIDVGTFARGGVVEVEASYPVTLADLPLLGRVSVTVSGSHTQRIDVYRSRAAAP